MDPPKGVKEGPAAADARPTLFRLPATRVLTLSTKSQVDHPVTRIADAHTFTHFPSVGQVETGF